MRPRVQSEFWDMLDTGNCVFLTKSVEDVHNMFRWIRHKSIRLSKYFMRGIAAIRSTNYSYYSLSEFFF